MYHLWLLIEKKLSPKSPEHFHYLTVFLHVIVHVFCSHKQPPFLSGVVSKTTCFFAPKYNKNLDFKGNLK